MIFIRKKHNLQLLNNITTQYCTSFSLPQLCLLDTSGQLRAWSSNIGEVLWLQPLFSLEISFSSYYQFTIVFGMLPFISSQWSILNSHLSPFYSLVTFFRTLTCLNIIIAPYISTRTKFLNSGFLSCLQDLEIVMKSPFSLSIFPFLQNK